MTVIIWVRPLSDVARERFPDSIVENLESEDNACLTERSTRQFLFADQGEQIDIVAWKILLTVDHIYITSFDEISLYQETFKPAAGVVDMFCGSQRYGKL